MEAHTSLAITIQFGKIWTLKKINKAETFIKKCGETTCSTHKMSRINLGKY